MSNLLKYTVPVWNDNIYNYNDNVLDIKTCDSAIRIFGMLNEDSTNEALIRSLVSGSAITVTISNLDRFIGQNNSNLEAVYNAWKDMETQGNAPHIVLGVWLEQTYCVWIDSWTTPNQMILTWINPSPSAHLLQYLTQTPDASSLLALSMLDNITHGWMWKDNIEYRRLNISNEHTLVTHRYNLNPVLVSNQDKLFNNWTTGKILISLKGYQLHNLFDAQVSDPVLSSTGLNWVQRTSSTGETCTLAADQWVSTNQYAAIGSSKVRYRNVSYHPVSRMMDTNYKGVYTTSKKDTIFINGSSYKPTSLLKHTNRLLRKD